MIQYRGEEFLSYQRQVLNDYLRHDWDEFDLIMQSFSQTEDADNSRTSKEQAALIVNSIQDSLSKACPA